MFLRALITAAAVLGIAAPVIAVALWQVRGNRQGISAVGAVAALAVLDEIVLRTPRLEVFSRLQWNWQGKILELCLSIVAIVILQMTRDEVAVRRPRPPWVWPTLAVTTAILLLPITFFFAARARETLTLEGWVFQLTVPGLAEELLFRGVIQGQLNRGLGRQWQILGTRIGWGWSITSLLFAAGHVVSVDRNLHIEFVLAAGIGPLVGSVISGWLRERIVSIWPLVVLHNASNLLIPALTLLLAH